MSDAHPLYSFVIVIAHFGRVHGFVMNDIGPFVPGEALDRIASYVGIQHVFDSIEEVEQQLRKNFAPWHPVVSEESQ